MLVKCQHEMSTKNKICKSVMYHKIAGAIALVCCQGYEPHVDLKLIFMLIDVENKTCIQCRFYVMI